MTAETKTNQLHLKQECAIELLVSRILWNESVALPPLQGFELDCAMPLLAILMLLL